MPQALQLALTLLDVIPAAVAAGRDVVSLVNSTRDTIKAAQDAGRDITPGEWDAMNEKIAELRRSLHAS